MIYDNSKCYGIVHVGTNKKNQTKIIGWYKNARVSTSIKKYSQVEKVIRE